MKENKTLLLTETPRDAMQGWPKPIPSLTKVRYINTLLQVGFETVDCGSFVSARAIPQMSDTTEVLDLLDLGGSVSKLMVIAGNTRGAISAAGPNKIHSIAYPFSVSETFLKRNLNTTPSKAWETISEIKSVCDKSGKNLRIYIAMAFGNPYGDPCNDQDIITAVEKLMKAGINDLVFSDITGVSTPESIQQLCSTVISQFPDLHPGLHLHSKPDDWHDKVEAAIEAGIFRFESAIGGYGGCPLTGYELLGNLDTLALAEWCDKKQIHTGIDPDKLIEASQITQEVFAL